MARHSLHFKLIIVVCSIVSAMTTTVAAQDELEIVGGVSPQPLRAQADRIKAALAFLGAPLSTDEAKQLADAIGLQDGSESVESIQRVLDSRCLAKVHINPESRVKVQRGPAKAELMESGWTVFLVKVHNEAGVTAALRVNSPNAGPVYKPSTGAKDPPQVIQPNDVENRWMDVVSYDNQPLNRRLSGLEVEYRIISIYSRDAGKREAKLQFDVGQGTQDLGFRNELPVLFHCQRAVRVTLSVLDDDGKPTTGQFVIRDGQNRVYPSRSKRLAPDFFFHDQVYRSDGEELLLPPGNYTVSYSRGPEYLVLKRKISVPDAEHHSESFRLKRWIKMTDHRWFSGDHHVHAAGCAHYESPSQGVTPEDMMRHILGEDLNVGCVLSWGPCWYYQKQFFEGATHRLSTPDYLMRYDVEVSGFPSSHTGHLCLLRLAEDDYQYPEPTRFDWRYGGQSGTFEGTKTTLVGEWPSWDLPVLQWGKKQGGVVGFSHSGWGLEVPGDVLPNYNMPKFDGIGANEYIVDVVHDACDFISSVDTPWIWELNIWYHTLNCGYVCRISGETDFPCIYGERVGLGRGYVKLDPDQDLNFDNWVQGIKDGRSYVGDGRTHLFDFAVNGLGVGEAGSDGRASVLRIAKNTPLQLSVRASAMLDEQPRNDIRNRPLKAKPYWHTERARLGDTRTVPVELIVNGKAVERKVIEADGSIHDLKWDFTPDHSCWVALRVWAACHTNPVFVEVDGQPIRASRRSAQWCRDAVDVCWKAKVGQIRPHERAEAKAAFDKARTAYEQILQEAVAD